MFSTETCEIQTLLFLVLIIFLRSIFAGFVWIVFNWKSVITDGPIPRATCLTPLVSGTETVVQRQI